MFIQWQLLFQYDLILQNLRQSCCIATANYQWRKFCLHQGQSLFKILIPLVLVVVFFKKKNPHEAAYNYKGIKTILLRSNKGISSSTQQLFWLLLTDTLFFLLPLQQDDCPWESVWEGRGHMWQLCNNYLSCSDARLWLLPSKALWGSWLEEDRGWGQEVQHMSDVGPCQKPLKTTGFHGGDFSVNKHRSLTGL